MRFHQRHKNQRSLSVWCIERSRFMNEWIPMPDNLDSEQRTRLWEYRLHIENQLYIRLTVFLTYETILLAVVGTLQNNLNSAKSVVLVLIVTISTSTTLFAELRLFCSVPTTARSIVSYVKK